MFVDADTLLGKYEDTSMSMGSFTPLGKRVCVEVRGCRRHRDDCAFRSSLRVFFASFRGARLASR